MGMESGAHAGNSQCSHCEGHSEIERFVSRDCESKLDASNQRCGERAKGKGSVCRWCSRGLVRRQNKKWEVLPQGCDALACPVALLTC